MSCHSQQCVSLMNSTVFAEYSRTSKIFIIIFKYSSAFVLSSLSQAFVCSGDVECLLPLPSAPLPKCLLLNMHLNKENKPAS